jgi:AhpD family alkylhydroperoxidase
MSNDWSKLIGDIRSASTHLANANPELVKAYRNFGATQSNGALDAKTRELIAVAVTTRCEGCIASHARAALEAGVTAEELSDALATAISLNAGAAFVFSSKALEAFEQFKATTA